MSGFTDNLKRIKKNAVDHYQAWRLGQRNDDEEQRRMDALFGDGYDSGDIERGLDDPEMKQEFERSGGNYLSVFEELIKPRLGPAHSVLEIGGGKGSWTRAVMNHYPDGVLTVVDRLPVEPLLRERCPGAGKRLVFQQITDNVYDIFEDGQFDYGFSMGVFVHIPARDIPVILKRMRPKLKPGSEFLVHYSNWDKLDEWGWERSEIPLWFKNSPHHDDVWWTVNNHDTMRGFATDAGFEIVDIDLNYFGRDSIARLRA